MRRNLPMVCALLAIGACRQDNASPVAQARASASAVGAASGPGPFAVAASAPGAASGRSVAEANDLYEFAYAYPAQAGAIPALGAWLDGEIGKQRSELRAQARQGRAEARDSGAPYNAYSLAIRWQVVTDIPGWLSLSANIDSYLGGAHPNHYADGLVWDRAANLRRKPLDLFASGPALSQAIRSPFCRQLDAQREARRGEKIVRGNGDPFTDCIDPAGEVVILGSSSHRSFDRIGVIVPPYDAGPYVEGGYEVTVPVTGQVLAAVKPEFRASFTAAQ